MLANDNLRFVKTRATKGELLYRGWWLFTGILAGALFIHACDIVVNGLMRRDSGLAFGLSCVAAELTGLVGGFWFEHLYKQDLLQRAAEFPRIDHDGTYGDFN